jgi:binding-protein-dependent transport system inner membrane component
MEVSPMDPVETYIGSIKRISTEQRQMIRERWGVDKPLPTKIANWAKNAIKGDLGYSVTFEKDVSDVIRQAFSNSLLLILTAWILSFVFGVLLGVRAAIRQNRLADRVIKTIAYLFSSIPAFWFGILLLLTFSVKLKWFPIGYASPIGKSENILFFEKLYHMFLPALTLSIMEISTICIYTREKLIEILDSDYALYEYARGKSVMEVVKEHGVRNILLPVVTLQFGSINEIIGGTLLIESVFSYNGIGRITIQAGLRGDLPLILAITIVTATIVFIGNLIANILYPLIDPRIREGVAN